MALAIDRSSAMIRLAYFFHEYARSGQNKRTIPPEELDDLSWREAYEQFFDELGDGREFDTFRRSAENLRGGSFREHKELGVAFLPKYSSILRTWSNLPRKRK